VVAAAAAPAAGTPAASTPTTAPATNPPTTPGMTTFKVLSVSSTGAVVTVDTVRYAVAVGKVFAKSYKLVKTTGGTCAYFSYGESKFGLCEGQTFIF